MANSIPVASDLVIILENGVSSTGRTLTKKLTYKNLKLNAPAADVMAVAQGIIGLQEKNSLAIYQVTTAEITE